MRTPVLVVVVAVVAAACNGSTSSTSVPDPTTATTSIESTTSDPVGTIPSSTPTSTRTVTSTLPVPLQRAVCDGYRDYLAAFDRDHELDALRRLDIAVGFPRPEGESRAISVLRDRESTISASEARSTLQDNYGPACGAPAPGDAGRFDRLLLEGVIVSGKGTVQLLDGTELIPEDPDGTYVEAYGSRAGGIAALEEIGGLEVVEYRLGTSGIPRDLALDADLLLHGTASIDGVEYAMVTTWEAGGVFGEETQFLDLLPLDGSLATRVGVVGTVTEAAESVSFAGGFFLVTESFLGGSDIYALGLDGARRQVPGLPLVTVGAPGVNTRPLQEARGAPGGDSFAYLRVTPGVGAGGVDVIQTDLVVQRLDDGTEEFSIEIGGRDQIFTSLDYDGHWAIAASRGQLVVVDTWGADGPGGAIEALSVAGIESARLLDGGLLFGR